MAKGCINVGIKVTDMDIFADMIKIMKEVTEDKLISSERKSYYENKIHYMIEQFEKDRYIER